MNEQQEKRFYEFVKDWLNDKYEDYELVEKVTDVKEVHKSSGFCDTCYHEWTELHITYIDEAGQEQTYEYYGSMAEFLSFDS